MISRTTSALNRRRALGCFLLLLIAFASTVVTVHSHGARSSDLHEPAAISDTGGAQPLHPGNLPTECAMCQFQQHLFNGLVHAPVFAVTISPPIASVAAPTVFYPSTLITQPSGRAPPLS